MERKRLLNDAGRYEEALAEWTRLCDEAQIPPDKREHPTLSISDGSGPSIAKHRAPDTFDEVIAIAAPEGATAWRLTLNGKYLASGKVTT